MSFGSFKSIILDKLRVFGNKIKFLFYFIVFFGVFCFFYSRLMFRNYLKKKKTILTQAMLDNLVLKKKIRHR